MIILENKHRFKDDPEYGQLLTNFWKGDLSEQERETVNAREVNGTSVTILNVLSSDKCVAPVLVCVEYIRYGYRCPIFFP
jgi:hypothetical protein